MSYRAIILLTLLLGIFSGCADSTSVFRSQDEQKTYSAPDPVVTSFGVGYSPPNYPHVTLDDYRQGLLEAATVGTHMSYIFCWDGGDSEFEVVARIMDSAKTLNLMTLLQFSPTSIGDPCPPENLNFSPKSFNNPDIRTQFLIDVRRLAELNPDYLNLCAELNLTYFFNWQEYEYFKTLYRESYTLVKGISPATKIGVSYHMDIFFADEEFALLLDLGPQDYIGFTSYPAYLVYEGHVPSLEEFPVEYYSRIREVLRIMFPGEPDKSVLFTEFGWPSDGDSNYNDQAEFIRRIPGLMQDVKPEIISWALLHDVNFFQTWKLNQAQLDLLAEYNINPELLFAHLNSMGLLFQHGPAKPAWFEAVGLDFTATP
jgi:hypothetical protein